MVCYCHVEAMAVYLTAWQHGLRIPDDLSVVGFNDLQSTKYMTPPLTTMGFGTRHIGRLGANLLVNQIESDGPRSNACSLDKHWLNGHRRRLR